MSMQNLSLTGTVEQSIVPAVSTSTDTGTGITTKGFRSLLACATVGAVSTVGDETLDIKLQECATVGGTYTDITGATFTQLTAVASPVTDVTFIEVDLLPRQQFIRAKGTIAGTTPSFAYGVSFVFYNAVDSAYAGTADSTTVT